jgi:hypothetical protein
MVAKPVDAMCSSAEMLMYLQCNQGGHHVSLDWTGYRQVFLHTCTVERVTLHSILHNRDVTMWY